MIMGARKLNIACIFSGELESGGGFQTQLSTIVELSKDERYNFIVFTTNRVDSNILGNYDLNVIHIKQNFLYKVFRLILRNEFFYKVCPKLTVGNKFEKVLYTYDIDLVYFLSPSSLALDLVCHNYIFTVWDLCYRDYPEFPEVSFHREFERREMLYSKALKKAIAIITDSELGKENIVRRYSLDENRVYFVSYLPSINIRETEFVDIKKRYHIHTENYLYYPAQFWPHKNHVYIIDSLSILKRQGIHITAVFSGSDKGNLGYVLEYAKKAGVGDLVKYIGFAPNEEIYYLYKQSLALAMPTYFGPTNIPPLEAFAVGTPVIYSDLPGLREQVRDAALLCDLKDPNSLAMHIETLLNNPEKRSELIEKGYKRLKELQQKSITNVLRNILEDYAVKLKCWKT